MSYFFYNFPTPAPTPLLGDTSANLGDTSGRGTYATTKYQETAAETSYHVPRPECVKGIRAPRGGKPLSGIESNSSASIR